MSPRARWTREDEAQVRALYPDQPTAEVARRLARTVRAIYEAAIRLGVRKSAEFLASPASGRLQPGAAPRGVATRYRKGQVPANKGLRRPGWSAGGMQKTQFAAGHHTWNWRPVGARRVVDGYWYTKISDLRRVPWTVNWRPDHLLLWTRSGGSVPPGHALAFQNGDATDLRLENIECIPRGELARRNTLQYPLALRRITQLRGAITRAINKRARHEK